MGKFIDLTGQRFGRLIVVEKSKKPENVKGSHPYWLCKCDCDNFKIIRGEHLKRGKILSCGCYQKEILENNRKIVDLANKKFGKLTVIGIDHKKKIFKNNKLIRSVVYWKCICECGNETILTGNEIKNGNTKSCGCSRYEGKGVQTVYNRIYYDYKKGAESRGFVFQLRYDFFEKKITEPCYYCGKTDSKINRAKKNKPEYFLNGIDRIDSSNGYTENNVVSCCFQCNQSKSNHSQQDFLSWVERVYNHSIKGKNMSDKFNAEKYLENAINKMLENETFKHQWELRDENQKEEFKKELYQSLIVPLLKFQNNLTDVNKKLNQ